MLLLMLTAAEAKHLAERVEDPVLLDKICAQLRQDEVFEGVVDAPKVVLFRDDGDGLHVAAIAYYEDRTAERAFELFGETVDKQRERLGPLFAKVGAA